MSKTVNGNLIRLDGTIVSRCLGTFRLLLRRSSEVEVVPSEWILFLGCKCYYSICGLVMFPPKRDSGEGEFKF